ncbi:glycosyltransferase family 4 protein [Segetibacter aerophilus]|nr:glycosyltransferase family 4 protein [Segetibacter aerophilus]
MNILVFTTAFYPSVGGLENQTYNLIEEFLKVGHRIKVITFQTELAARQGQENKEKQLKVLYNPNLLKVLSLFLWCDVFYMPNFSLKGIWFIPFRPFKRWIISHNDLYLSNRDSEKTRVKLLLIKLASQNIAVSNCIAKYIDTSSKIIYNCYDNEIFKIYEDEKRIAEFIFLGRLVSQKGCELLIKACRNLNTDFTLSIVGDGPEKGELERLVRNYKLDEKIKFLGILEGESLARVLNRHHVMVIPSIDEEGFGIVALEGLACGCKIIAADAGGLSEAVKGFGKLFEMGNQKELEVLLKEELKELRTSASPPPTAELQNYLAEQKKEAVAKQYLKLFQKP